MEKAYCFLSESEICRDPNTICLDVCRDEFDRLKCKMDACVSGDQMWQVQYPRIRYGRYCIATRPCEWELLAAPASLCPPGAWTGRL